MTRPLLLFLLLQIAAAPAALGLDQALAARLRELSAETFLDAIVYELRKDPAARLALGQARETGEPWAAGNRFYLEALKARDEGRVFDAHYLAKRSYAIYSKR
ncbi:MAG: hypothetical protein CVU79_10265, partial [Elusimicrobia bacterium HGW-Elusimicrobia-3]